MKTITIQVTDSAYWKLQKEAMKLKTSPKVIAQTWVSTYPKAYTNS